MKKFMRSMAVVMLLALSFTTVGILSRNDKPITAAKTENKSKKKIKLNKKKATIKVGKAIKLKLKNAKAKKVKWRSTNKKVATVSKKGTVKARKKGKTTIIAKYKGKKYRCKITVKKAVIKKTENKINGVTLKQAVYLSDSLYDNKNIIVSPTSLNMALGMVANGASADALKVLEEYLGKNLEQYNKFSKKLINRAKKDSMITLANGVWYRDIYNLNPSFSDNITKYYCGEINAALMDNTTVDEINKWAYDKTDGMIEKVIEELDSKVVAVLSNALLFQGEWTSPFEANDTYDGKFTTASGKKVNAKLMNGVVSTYFENDYATGFEKTYGKNKEYSFIAILPKTKGDFELADMDVEGLLETKTTKYEVKIEIPKFSYSWDKSLKDVLMKTKLKKIFDDTKNPLGNLLYGFTGDVWVDDIYQSCKIVMDEEGTEAAAVTTVIIKCTSAIIPTKEIKTVKLNRPFAYIIKDNTTGEVMFMGKVVDTSKE